jgi:hypothetical protein
MLACENIVSCEWYQTPADAEFFIQHPTLNRAEPRVAPAGAKLSYCILICEANLFFFVPLCSKRTETVFSHKLSTIISTQAHKFLHVLWF